MIETAIAGTAGHAQKGRGAVSNASGRYEAQARVRCDDGWGGLDAEAPPIRTTVGRDATRSIIARNDSPDVPFDRSINPYRGCEHGCIYCYARPSHAWLGLSPGIDFESRLFAKPEAAALLRHELAAPGYRCRVMAMGTNTDPYQPVEREWQITRQVLEVLSECHHPVSIVTKSALVGRDIDILASMARRGLAKVFISVTTLDRALARRLEPRAATPERRLETMASLNQAGVPAGLMLAPVIPGLNDPEIEAIMERARAAGACDAGWQMLRLPLELKSLWREWLDQHYPDRSAKIMKLIHGVRMGRDSDPAFGRRMTGTGAYADLIASRFALAAKRLGFNRRRLDLDCTRFAPPPRPNQQLSLL